jgi:predicted transcriptional regulator
VASDLEADPEARASRGGGLRPPYPLAFFFVSNQNYPERFISKAVPRPRKNLEGRGRRETETTLPEKKRIKWKGEVSMKRFCCWVSLVVLVMFSAQVWAIELGQVPPKVELKGKLGGRLDGSPWSSDELQGKVHIVFYVDPDEKDTNNPASEALDKEKYPDDKVGYFGIINMAATWMPNFAINMALKEKQERYKKTIYLRDYQKVLVKAWKIADDSSVVLVFDKKGRLIFRKDGKLNEAEIRNLVKTVWDNL